MVRRLFGIGVLALVLPLGACEDENVTGTRGSGEVSVLLTDAAGDIESAVVVINSVYFQGEGSDSTDGRVFLVGSADASAGIEVDLVELKNEVATLVRNKPAPAGTYSQLRIVIDEACIVVDGETASDRVFATQGYEACGAASGRLQTTSMTTSGLKIQLPGGFQVTEGDQALLIDFDVSQSFGKQAGQSGMWVMKPVIKATAATQAADLAVELALGTGVTLPAGVALSGFKLQLKNAEGSTEEMALGADGKATFRFLFPGTYTVTLVGPGGFNITATPGLTQSVSVAANASASTSFTLTGITAVGTGG